MRARRAIAIIGLGGALAIAAAAAAQTMAPLSGFEQSPVGSLWNRLGAFLYQHGGAVYNFQGLRAFKDKFDPVWEPHYLAYPGGLHPAANSGGRVGAGGRRLPQDLPQAMTVNTLDSRSPSTFERRVLIESVTAAVCGYVLAAMVEVAVIRSLRPSEWELAW